MEIFSRWKNVEGQTSLIQQILRNPDVFTFADYSHHSIAYELLKSPPDMDNRSVKNLTHPDRIAVWNMLGYSWNVFLLQGDWILEVTWASRHALGTGWAGSRAGCHWDVPGAKDSLSRCTHTGTNTGEKNQSIFISQQGVALKFGRSLILIEFHKFKYLKAWRDRPWQSLFTAACTHLIMS